MYCVHIMYFCTYTLQIQSLTFHFHCHRNYLLNSLEKVQKYSSRINRHFNLNVKNWRSVCDVLGTL